MMCAITLTLIGHFGLDEDKCLGLGCGGITPAGFHSVSERKNIFINGILDVTGLSSLIINVLFGLESKQTVFKLLYTNTYEK